MLDWFAAAVTNANAVKDISKSLVTLRDEEMIRSRVFDLTTHLMELQQQLMTAQLEQMELVKRVAELEQQNNELQRQSSLESQYELHPFPTGMLAYRLKPDQQNGQPEHFLCSKCFERGLKSTMHQIKDTYSSTLFCPECKVSIDFEPRRPRPPRFRTVHRNSDDWLKY
ncbi:MAG: hypothetical protein NDI93_01945 [Pseudomonas sp.]|nr:hypothetical protein [Pseudomonas sp.]